MITVLLRGLYVFNKKINNYRIEMISMFENIQKIINKFKKKFIDSVSLSFVTASENSKRYSERKYKIVCN